MFLGITDDVPTTSMTGYTKGTETQVTCAIAPTGKLTASDIRPLQGMSSRPTKLSPPRQQIVTAYINTTMIAAIHNNSNTQ